MYFRQDPSKEVILSTSAHHSAPFSIFVPYHKNHPMRYAPIDKQLFIDNRKRFAASLKPNSIAIFNSNDVLPTSADGHMKFMQATDIFYLSGVDQEESILIIYPDAKDGVHKEVLFLKETSELIA